MWKECGGDLCQTCAIGCAEWTYVKSVQGFVHVGEWGAFIYSDPKWVQGLVQVKRLGVS